MIGNLFKSLSSTFDYYMGRLDSQLIVAARNGDIASVQKLILVGANVNCQEDGFTPLWFATLRRHSNIAIALINAGANVDAVDEYGFTALHWTNHIDIATALINAGANLNATDNRGGTPLFWAARHGRFDIVIALIKAGANVNATDHWRGTPLHFAAGNGHTNIVAALINAGANVNNIDNDGVTALVQASVFNHYDCVALLLKASNCVDAPIKPEHWTDDYPNSTEASSKAIPEAEKTLIDACIASRNAASSEILSLYSASSSSSSSSSTAAVSEDITPSRTPRPKRSAPDMPDSEEESASPVLKANRTRAMP